MTCPFRAVHPGQTQKEGARIGPFPPYPARTHPHRSLLSAVNVGGSVAGCGVGSTLTEDPNDGGLGGVGVAYVIKQWHVVHMCHISTSASAAWAIIQRRCVVTYAADVFGCGYERPKSDNRLPYDRCDHHIPY